MLSKDSRVESVWNELLGSGHALGITGRRAPGLPPDRPVYLAIDEHRVRHVLVPVSKNAGCPHVATRGLHVSAQYYAVAGRPVESFLDISCVDEAHFATFAAVTTDLLDSLARSGAPPLDVVALALDRWRAFWRADSPGLSEDQALGLFGELWFLRRWLADWSLKTLSHWTAPAASRHDFQWPLASVEVKSSVGGAGRPPVHRIASVEQLESPETGELYLFSLHVVEDALSANTLAAMIDEMTAKLIPDKESLSQFNAKLAAWGYTPTDAGSVGRPLRVIGEGLYKVSDAFPRLTRGSLGKNWVAGVTDIRYSVDMAACAGWLVAARPDAPEATRLRGLTIG